jgi:peptide deformylase
MSLLKIARMGHPVLFTPAHEVSDITAPEIRALAQDMIETMLDAPGVGLAAPQVYVPLRLFVFRVPAARAGGGEDIPPTVLINPSVEAIGDEIMMCTEGCLSIPGMRGTVPRAAHIRYKGWDCDGNLIEREATGFHANVIQHEYDHLEGVLYPMRLVDFTSFGYVEEFNRASNGAAA